MIGSKKYNSVKINKQNIKKFDCIILITNHKKFNYDIIKKNSKLILDTEENLEFLIKFKNIMKKKFILYGSGGYVAKNI